MNTHDPSRLVMLAIALALSLATPACGGCGPEPDPGADSGADAGPDADGGGQGDGGGTTDLAAWCQTPLQDTITLSEETRELHGVSTARYTMNAAEDSVRIALFDDAGDEVSALLFVFPDPNLVPLPTVRIEGPGLDPIDFTFTNDLPADDSYAYTELTASQGGQEKLVYLGHYQGLGTLESWLAVPAESGDVAPDDSVYLQIGDGVLHAIPVIEDGDYAVDEIDDPRLEQWLVDSGAADFLSQPHLLAAGAAYSNEVMAAIYDHGLTCERYERTASFGLGDGSTSCTRRQGLDTNCKPHRDGVTTTLQVIGFVSSLVPLTAGINMVKAGLAATNAARVSKGLVETGKFFLYANLGTRLAVSAHKFYTTASTGRKQFLRWFNCRKSGDPQACTKGDPHLITFDGLSFDLQAAGEFVMIDGDAPDAPTVHARFEPIGDALCGDVSIATGLAVRFLGQTLSIENTSDGLIRRVDGQPVDRWADAVSLPEGASLIEDRRFGVMVWPDGSFVSSRASGRRIDIVYQLSDRWRGKVRGVNGDYDGEWLDDITTADGRDLLSGLTFGALYDDYAASWRVTNETSLFTYPDGTSTDTYTLPNFPLREAVSDLLELEPFQRALEACEEADVRPEWLEACVLDVGCTGDESFIEAMERLGDRDAQLALLDAPPTLEGDVTLLGAPPSVQDDDFVDPRRALVFLETSNTTLRRALPVDAASDGTYAAPGDLEDGAEINAGSDVRSYMVHLDPGQSFAGARTARLTFTTPIIGVAMTPESLAASDARAGASGTVYPRDDSRGLELGDDSVAISEDRLTLDITWTADSELDQARVFVVAPPALEDGQ